MTSQEAEAQWRIHGNEALRQDPEYQRALEEQRRVGRRVGQAYVRLVLGLLAFMAGFYLWRFRFFWAIAGYVALLTMCAFSARVIIRCSVMDDHLGDIVSKVHRRYVAERSGQ